MVTRVNDGATQERHENVLFSSRAAALVSRVSRLRRSRARALLSLNLKKKRDCSQSTLNDKREFVPREQVSPLLVAYCLLFLHINL